MEDWNESFLAVEVERELEKHKAERESLDLSATGANSVWRILLGLVIGLTVLIMVCLFMIK